MFIAIEGIDGVGKYTQSKILVGTLNNVKCPASLVSFPDYTSTTGIAIKQYLDREESWLNFAHPQAIPFVAAALFASNRIEYMATHADKLKSTVVFNRYVLSNAVYQAANMYTPAEQAMLSAWIVDYEFNKLMLPKPDLVIILDLPVEISMSLVSKRQKNLDAYESNEDMLRFCRQEYLSMAAQESYGLNYAVIDCASPVTRQIRSIGDIAGDVYASVWTHVADKIGLTKEFA